MNSAELSLIIVWAVAVTYWALKGAFRSKQVEIQVWDEYSMEHHVKQALGNAPQDPKFIEKVIKEVNKYQLEK